MVIQVEHEKFYNLRVWLLNIILLIQISTISLGLDSRHYYNSSQYSNIELLEALSGSVVES